jgi:DNA polymerase-3 subunit alpha
MPEPPFAHLHCHSDYSLLDGACSIVRLIGAVAAMGMPAVGLTEHASGSPKTGH